MIRRARSACLFEGNKAGGVRSFAWRSIIAIYFDWDQTNIVFTANLLKLLLPQPID
jgi:hypothetical protein